MLPEPANFASLYMLTYIPDIHVHITPLLKILAMGMLLAWPHNIYIAFYLAGGVNLLAEVKNIAGEVASPSHYGVWELAPPVNIGGLRCILVPSEAGQIHI